MTSGHYVLQTPGTPAISKYGTRCTCLVQSVQVPARQNLEMGQRGRGGGGATPVAVGDAAISAGQSGVLRTHIAIVCSSTCAFISLEGGAHYAIAAQRPAYCDFHSAAQRLEHVHRQRQQGTCSRGPNADHGNGRPPLIATKLGIRYYPFELYSSNEYPYQCSEDRYGLCNEVVSTPLSGGA